MNDETQPGNRSAEAAGYRRRNRFAADADYPDVDADVEDGAETMGDFETDDAGAPWDVAGGGDAADAGFEVAEPGVAGPPAEFGSRAEPGFRVTPAHSDVFSRPEYRARFTGPRAARQRPGRDAGAEPGPLTRPTFTPKPGYSAFPRPDDGYPADDPGFFARPAFFPRPEAPAQPPAQPGEAIDAEPMSTPKIGAEPAAEAEPAVLPEPTALPEPTVLPEPTGLPEPALPEPAAVPEPTAEAEPAPLPEPPVLSPPVLSAPVMEAEPDAETLTPMAETLTPMEAEAPADAEEPAAWEAEAPAGWEAEAPAGWEAEEPGAAVEVPGRPTTQHPLRTSGELSVLRTPQSLAGMDAPLPDNLWGYENYPVVESAPPADDQGGLVSLGYIGAALKRNKKVWILTTVLGILAAVGLYGTYHAKYTNTATVMLALDPNLDPASAIQTDAILAVDSTMAQQAMQKLGVRKTVPEFLKTYTVTVSTTSNDLLTFTATGPTGTAAYNEANTLAATFLQYRAQTELAKESVNTSSQDQQVTQTQQTIDSLKSQIKTLKQGGANAGDSKLARLQNELTNAQNLLASLQQTVASNEATLRSTTAGLIAGSRVLDTGIPAAGTSKKKFALEYGGGAIFGGLVIGVLIVAIGAIVSDRLRRRDDVAAALGAPVRVSVASGGKRSGKTNREADLKRVADHLRNTVPSGTDGAGSLVVVAVDDSKFVSEAIREVAVSAARDGKRVVLADLSGGALSHLFKAKEPGIRGVDAGGVRVVLVIPERGELAPVGPLHAPTLGTPMNGVPNVHAAADVFITLATLNPATGAAHLKTWGDDAVAVVTAGESSVTKVQPARAHA